MKKYVLSAIVTGLLVPSAYAMDGAAPPVEVEVPVVETPAIEHGTVVVDHVVPGVEDVKVEVVDVAPGDTGVVETHHMGVLTFRQDVAEGVPFDPDTQPKEYAEWVAEHPGVVVDPNADDKVVNAFDGIVPVCLGSSGGDILVKTDENGNQIAVCYFGGLEPVEGVAVDDNGNPIHVMNFGLMHEEFHGADPVPVDENGNPVLHAIDLVYEVDENGKQVLDDNGNPIEVASVDPNAIDLAAQSGVPLHGVGPVAFNDGNDATTNPVEKGGEVAPIRYAFGGSPADMIQRRVEFTPASSGSNDGQTAPNDGQSAPNAQLLNDEQRGAVHVVRSEGQSGRSDVESTKPHTGMGKLFSRFRHSDKEVIQASATTTAPALSTKLAEVDRMRDTALRTGDKKALAKADKLEKDLRAQTSKAPKARFWSK